MSSLSVHSTVSLATKCTVASFRMHLRAHSTLSKIFTALHDASQHAVSGRRSTRLVRLQGEWREVYMASQVTGGVEGGLHG